MLFVVLLTDKPGHGELRAGQLPALLRPESDKWGNLIKATGPKIE